jgi:dienelactone hydrolase
MTSKSSPADLGIVLVGVPATDRAVREQFEARGYPILVADVDDGGDIDAVLAVVRAAMDAVAARARKVAVVGYGAGGRYAFLAVTRLGADAAAALRGTNIGVHLDESMRVKKPLSFHFADDDARVPFEEVRAIKGALEGFGTTEIYRYPTFDEAAVRQAETRVFAFLDSLGVK